MRLQKRQLTGREKDDEAIQLLEKLREQLFLSNITVARQTAFHLSWLQEDGMEILKEALTASNSTRQARVAAAYGLRKMRGRMRAPSLDILKEGAQSKTTSIANICKNALSVLDGTHKPYKRPSRRRGHSRFEIRDLPPRGNRRATHTPRDARRFNR